MIYISQRHKISKLYNLSGTNHLVLFFLLFFANYKSKVFYYPIK